MGCANHEGRNLLQGSRARQGSTEVWRHGWWEGIPLGMPHPGWRGLPPGSLVAGLVRLNAHRFQIPEKQGYRSTTNRSSSPPVDLRITPMTEIWSRSCMKRPFWFICMSLRKVSPATCVLARHHNAASSRHTVNIYTQSPRSSPFTHTDAFLPVPAHHQASKHHTSVTPALLPPMCDHQPGSKEPCGM